MKKSNQQNFSKTIFVFALSLFLLLSTSIPARAFAFDPKQWLRSADIEPQVNELNKHFQEASDAIAQANKTIEFCEGNRELFEQEKSDAEYRYNEAFDLVENNREKFENIAKNSYAAIFAKTFLDDLVGNSLITSDLFHWGLVTFFSCSEDQKIISIIEEFYDARSEYENMLQIEQDTEKSLTEASDTINYYSPLLAKWTKEKEELDARYKYLVDMENKYGKALDRKASNEAYFTHPCPEGSVTSKFGEIRGEGESQYIHKGTDYGAKEGTPIYAAGDGKVTYATYDDGYNGGMGMCVYIQHAEGFVTKYFHCSHVFIPVGMEVHRGDNIALVGNTGDSRGSHLHFQVEFNGNPIDGEPLLKANH